MTGLAFVPSIPPQILRRTAFSAKPLVLNPTVTAADIDAVVQLHLDQAAQRRGYADPATCVSYISSANTTWATDAKAMIQWRDDAWSYAIAQEAISPLPAVASVLFGVDALASNPKW